MASAGREATEDRTVEQAVADLGFDPTALRRKYREERDRRLREDGNEQYVEVVGEFAHFLDDPYAEPGFEREPLTDEVEVLIVGGGFGGLLAGARLRQAGVQGIRIVDAGSDFGGTWYWNRYPGIACDIESYTYLPLLEEVGYVPKEKYSYGREILDHSQAIAREFDLYRDVCFQTRVEAFRWDEDLARWIVTTNRGDRMKARYLCRLATGPLNRPKLPGIPGIEEFRGALLSRQPLGLPLHGRRFGGQPHRAAGQEGGHHRDGRDVGAVRPPRRRVGRAPLRLPAYALLDRREAQPPPPIPSGRGVSSPAGIATAWRTSTPWCRVFPSRRTW